MRAGRAFVVAARTNAGIQIKELAQGHIQRADAATHWSGEGPLDRHAEVADRLEGVFRKVLIGAIKITGLITGINLEPLDRFLTFVGLSHRRIEHLLSGGPDVHSGAVTANERDDRIVRNYGLAVFEADWGALGRGGELLKLSHGKVAAWRHFGFGELMTRGCCLMFPVTLHARSMVKPAGVWVVAACFNEEAVITVFIERVLALPVVERLVLIDDGSSDDTVAQIRLWQARQAQLGAAAPVTLVELTRNFGKEAAMLAGLDHVRGECAAAVLIDSDLQHPPELIEAMVQKWRDGAEVVTAVRDDSDEESRFKVASAHWFYRVFNKLVDSIQIKEGAGDYRLLDAQALDAVTSLRESSRFSKGLLPWTGYRSEELPYQRVIRSGGQTSWSPFKLVSYAFDGIFSFSVLPLKVWTGLGALISLLSLVYAFLIALRTVLIGVDVPGYASMMTAVLFLGGIQLIGIGVLGDYIGRIYVEAKDRPHYFIRAIHNS